MLDHPLGSESQTMDRERHMTIHEITDDVTTSMPIFILTVDLEWVSDSEDCMGTAPVMGSLWLSY